MAHLVELVWSSEVNEAIHLVNRSGFIIQALVYIVSSWLFCKVNWRIGLIFGTVWEWIHLSHIISPLDLELRKYSITQGEPRINERIFNKSLLIKTLSNKS